MRTAILAILLLSALQAEAGWKKPGYRTRSREQVLLGAVHLAQAGTTLFQLAQKLNLSYANLSGLLGSYPGLWEPVRSSWDSPTNSSPEVRLSPAGRRLAALAPINGSYLLIVRAIDEVASAPEIHVRMP